MFLYAFFILYNSQYYNQITKSSETKEKETERRHRRPGLIPINNVDIVQGINKANMENFA